MYRAYEDPFKVQTMLDEARSYAAEHPEDWDAQEEVHALEERLNFAWQDDEAEIEGYD